MLAERYTYPHEERYRCTQCQQELPFEEFLIETNSKVRMMQYCLKCYNRICRYDEKRCKKCGVVKPMLDFYTHDNSIDHHRHECKTCVDGGKPAPAVSAAPGRAPVKGNVTAKELAKVPPAWKLQKTERDERNAMLKRFGFYWKKEGSGFKLRYKNGDEWSEIEATAWCMKNGETHKASTKLDALRRISALVKRDGVLFLDTETTGLGELAEVIDIALVDINGEILLDTLVKAEGPMNPDAESTHGISMKMLEDAPPFGEVWPVLSELLAGRDVVIYNANFDVGRLEYMVKRYGMEEPNSLYEMPKFTAHCLMNLYMDYLGEEKRQKLSVACAEFGVTAKYHRALADAEASRQVALAMTLKYDME